MAAGNNALWQSVCEVVELPDLATDPDYESTTLRAQNQVALRDRLETVFMTEDAGVWLARFRAKGVPCAPINRYSEVLVDEQVNHMAWVQPIELPNGVQTQTFASPLRFDGKGAPIPTASPCFG